MRVIIIGSSGQLGSDLVKVFKEDSKHEVYGLTHEDIEVEDYGSCTLIRDLRPQAVIITAAFHRVDECEDEPERAFKVNSLGSLNVSRICKEIGAIYVYISTDYVFDGEKNSPYTEEDRPRPLNVYGHTKLLGEYFAGKCGRHYVVRTSSLFGVAGSSGKGGNFVETIIRKAKLGEELRVVSDIVMSPTHTLDLAKAIRSMVEQELPSGIYHIAGSGYCSWWEFAKEILSVVGLPVSIKPITSVEYPQRARRPRFSALTSVRLPTYGISMPDWRYSLREYLKIKGHI